MRRQPVYGGFGELLCPIWEIDDAHICVIDSLIDRPQLKPAEKDYLNVLSDLVERYESERHPIPPLPDSELLQHLIELKGGPAGGRGS